MTTKVDITPSADAPTELRTGYHKFLLMLKESNKKCVFLLVSPLNMGNAIVELDDIPTKISALMRHFTATLNIMDKTRSVWATERIGFDRGFEMMNNNTDYDICADIILLMKERL